MTAVADSLQSARLLRLSYRQRLALVTAIGASIRLALLVRQSLGMDEDFTFVVTRMPLPDMLTAISRDSGTPLHYLLVWIVERLVPGVAGLRLVSAVAGIALIPIVAALARRALGARAGLWAATFIAVLPAAVYASENGRAYALAAALSAAAALALWRAVEVPSGGRWAAYALIAAAGVWTSYFAAFALLAAVLAAGLATPALQPPPDIAGRPGVRHARRRILSIAAGATALAGLSLVPWLAFASAQLSHVEEPFWVAPLGLTMAAGTYGVLFAGPATPPYVPWSQALLTSQYAAVAAGSLAFAGLLVRHAAVAASRRAVAFCAVAGGAGILVLAALSLWRPLLDARYAGVTVVPLFALAGAGLALLPRRVAAGVIACLLVSSLAVGVLPAHRETESLVPVIEARLGPSDLVAAQPDEYLVLLADGDAELRARLHVLAASDPPWYAGTSAYPDGAVIHALPANVARARGRVLYVASPGEELPVALPGYGAVDQSCVVGVCLTVLAPTP